jgi:hypothetical protein
VAGSHNTVTINCGDKKTQQQMAEVLRRLHDSQIPVQRILDDLDQIIHLVNDVGRNMPRHLTPDERNRLVSVLAPVKGVHVAIICSPDSDACDFARDFQGVFRSAGWERLSLFDTIDPETHEPDRRPTATSQPLRLEGVSIGFDYHLRPLDQEWRDKFLAILAERQLVSGVETINTAPCGFGTSPASPTTTSCQLALTIKIGTRISPPSN